MLRSVLLCLVTFSLSAADLTRDELYGFWVVDEKAVSKEQKEHAEAAKKIESFGMNITLRTTRVIFSSDNMIAGMWRLDDAKDNTGTIVIQTKGGSEHRYHITKEKDHLIVKECPGQLKLKNAR